jgi:electron transport complex protein RnfG
MSENQKPAFQNRVAYHATLLGGFATLSAALLIIGDLTTSAPIAARQEEDMRASLSQVILPELHDNNLLDNQIQIEDNGRKVDVYQAIKGGQVTGVAYEIYGYGYGGEIDLMMGVNTAGEILGVRVLSHAETPGLGDKIETAKSKWIFEFDGKSLDNTSDKQWHVKKDGGEFDQFSGATITPRAVVKAVKSGLVFFKAHQAELIRLHIEAKE